MAAVMAQRLGEGVRLSRLWAASTKSKARAPMKDQPLRQGAQPTGQPTWPPASVRSTMTRDPGSEASTTGTLRLWAGVCE